MGAATLCKRESLPLGAGSSTERQQLGIRWQQWQGLGFSGFGEKRECMHLNLSTFLLFVR